MKQFQTSFERLATIYSKQAGLRLVVKGDGFSTDGKTVFIADVPDELIEGLRDPSLAGLIHECMHVRNSDITLLNVAPVARKHKCLVNNIEDLRMLKLGTEEYRGLFRMHVSGMEFLGEHFKKRLADGEIDIPASDRLGMAIQYMKTGLDARWLGELTVQAAEKTRDIWDNYPWRGGVERTQETIEVAERIVKRLEMVRDEEEKNDKAAGESGVGAGSEEDERDSVDGNGRENKSTKEGDDKRPDNGGDEWGDNTDGDEPDSEEGGDQDGGTGGGEVDGEDDDYNDGGDDETTGGPGEDDGYGDESEGEPEEGGGDEDSSPKTGSESKGGKKTKESGSGEEPEEEPKGDKKPTSLKEEIDEILEGSREREENSPYKIMERMIQDIVRKFNIDNNRHVAAPSAIAKDVEYRLADLAEKMKAEEPHKARILEELFDKHVGTVEHQVAILRSKILPTLLAEKRTSFAYEQDEGHVDDAGLYRLTHGNGKIFKQQMINRKVNTAVSILNDISGSMNGSKVDMLRPTARVLGDILFALKVPFEQLAFTTDPFRYTASRILPDGTRYYNRVEPLYHIVIKSFEENYINSRDNIQYLHSRANNCDNESFMWAAKRLAQRKEERKILIVLSDGMPAIDGDTYLLEKDLIENVQAAMSIGIEVLGVGILTDAPREYYPHFVEISSTDTISTALYGALLKLLEKGFTSSRRG